MNLEIRNSSFDLQIFGFSGIALNKDYAGTAFRLMDKMWQIVKGKQLNSKGLNIWVYEPGDKVFAGVELVSLPDVDAGLEQKNISIAKYAYYKHIGPYSLIKQAGHRMNNELKEKGFESTLPYIEIYGHMVNDESKLETELIMTLK